MCRCSDIGQSAKVSGYPTGNVDHGKTLLLDRIRGTAVTAKEPGAVTQWVGCSYVPRDVIKKIGGKWLQRLKIEIRLPGLLFIDLPGHEVFVSLRKRGGSLADVAVLVIDIMEGIKPQTEESLNILKMYKTPFVIAANKIDKLSGWVANKDMPFLESYEKQRSSVQEGLDTALYKLIGTLYERGLQAERFDKITDFKKQVAIVPVSALTGEGVAELLAILTGITQRFLEKKLVVEPKGSGRGTVLEVKETKGLGLTADVILYDGLLKKGDLLVIGSPSVEEIIETRVKAILKTAPLKELRVEKKFFEVEEVAAAAGVKIASPDLERVIAGVPFAAVREEKDLKRARQLVRKEIESVEIKTSPAGVIIKADALGSLEALARMLMAKEIPIKKATIGTVAKKDVAELEGVEEKYKVIFSFNTDVLPEAADAAKGAGVKILSSNVIYKLTEDYEAFVKALEESEKKKVLETLVRPAKFRFLPQFVFHVSKPAIVGVEILGGVLRAGVKVMRQDGTVIGEVKALQEKGETIKEAVIGQQVAASIEGAVVDRTLKKGDILLTAITKEDYRKLKEHEDLIAPHEKGVLEEIREIMRKKEPMWEFV